MSQIFLEHDFVWLQALPWTLEAMTDAQPADSVHYNQFHSAKLV